MVQTDRAPARRSIFTRAGSASGPSRLGPGCSVVPKSRLDDAARVTKALAPENAANLRGPGPCARR